MDFTGRCIGYELTNNDQLMVETNTAVKRRVGENIIVFWTGLPDETAFFYGLRENS
jgi:hypothetical protein